MIGASRLAAGTGLPHLSCRGTDGEPFDISTLAGWRCLISFYRFASRPFCNRGVRQMVSLHEELEGMLEVVAIFDPSANNDRKDEGGHLVWDTIAAFPESSTSEPPPVHPRSNRPGE